MRQFLLVCCFCFFSFACLGQTVEVIPWKPSSVQAMDLSDRTISGIESSPNAYFSSDVRIFPHVVTGGSWETVIVMVNLSPVPINYKTYFYNQQGGPMSITFREFPSMNVVTTSAINSTLPPGASFNFSLFDSTPNTQVGWASIEVVTPNTSLGGYSVFRQRVAGRADFEALVPLSSYEDHRFFLPVDEIQGFVTAMAMCNPASNLSTTVLLQMLNLNGVEIARKTITLAPGEHRAFAIIDEFPEMQNRLGTLYVRGSSNRLSAIGLRFNTAGGNSFSSVPIMNSGQMF